MRDPSDVDDFLLASIAANASEPHERALAREVMRHRAEIRIRRCETHPGAAESGWGCPDCVAELRRLIPSDSDRAALAIAVLELKERRGTYAMLARCTPATDEFVVTAYKDGIAAVEAAIAVVERMAKR